MRLRIHKTASEGSITVFLSLILILILSLLLTIIEGARINTAKVYAERALSTGMDSVLAEYYAPLWKEYHLFGLDAGYGAKTFDQDEMLLKLKDYMSYTFHPNGDKKSFGGKEGVELFGISPENTSLESRTMLMDKEGKLFVNEAVEYIKYEDLSDIAELFLGKLSLMETPKKVSYLYEEKQKVSEELVEIDEGLLELMELLDGVGTSKKGIRVNKDHTLKVMPYFVKKICIGEVTQDKVGINQESVFLALKNSYIDPLKELDQIEANFIKVNELNKNIEEAGRSYNMIQANIEQLNRAISSLQGIPSKEAMIAIQQMSANLYSLIGSLYSIQRRIDQYQREKNQCLEDIKSTKNRLTELNAQLRPKIERAVSVIHKILKKTGDADQLINLYEQKLHKEEEGLEDDLYNSFKDELNDMKRYTSDEGDYNFSNMIEILQNDLSILNQAQLLLNQSVQYLQENNYNSSARSFKEAGNIFRLYQNKGLKLDYSTFVLEKEEEANPINNLKSCLQDGIMSLVVDTESISKSVLSTETLPTDIHALEKEENTNFDFTQFFDNCNLGNKETGADVFFGSAGDEMNGLSYLGNGINILAENFLFQQYLKEHFMNYPLKGENLKSRKPSALIYEQEYLLLGKSSDKDNISSVISRIIFMRAILDFVSILKDRTKCNEAKAAAAVLVGFTGLPILVSITQTVILLMWAFAEALVDTSAIMMGKEVEIIKKSIVLNFTDLFLLNRQFIQKKAEQMTAAQVNSGKAKLALSYQDYLRIFLVFKKKETLAYRSMDLIQENLQIRYDDNFMFQNCLFGYKVSSDFNIKSKFIAFPFMQQYTGKVQGYRYHTEYAYSY